MFITRSFFDPHTPVKGEAQPRLALTLVAFKRAAPSLLALLSAPSHSYSSWERPVTCSFRRGTLF